MIGIFCVSFAISEFRLLHRGMVWDLFKSATKLDRSRKPEAQTVKKEVYKHCCRLHFETEKYHTCCGDYARLPPRPQDNRNSL